MSVVYDRCLRETRESHSAQTGNVPPDLRNHQSQGSQETHVPSTRRTASRSEPRYVQESRTDYPASTSAPCGVCPPRRTRPETNDGELRSSAQNQARPRAEARPIAHWKF